MTDSDPPDTLPVTAAHRPPDETPHHPVDPVRAAAGRLGGKRVHELAVLGRQYERALGLTPGRQRQKQLVQLGRRYEVEQGLRSPAKRRTVKGDAWAEFVAALDRVVEPAHRPALTRLVGNLKAEPTGHETPVSEQAA